jgi:hypothetical protein
MTAITQLVLKNETFLTLTIGGTPIALVGILALIF